MTEGVASPRADNQSGPDSTLETCAPSQTSLFPNEARGADPSEASPERRERAAKALDPLRHRFGRGTVVPGSLLGRELRRRSPPRDPGRQVGD